jgi:nucleoside-diphosphate-sugar epimerase
MGQERHVVFGAGQVGSLLAERLLALGHEVRVAKRSPGGVPHGALAVLGDAAREEFCTEAAAGAAVVYHCMNPPYNAKAWAELLPRYMQNLIAASARAGARLVVLDNVYMLGRPNGRRLSEETPANPSSRKGEIRAQVSQMMFDAHRRGDVRATSARASDFYGPRGTLTLLGNFFWPRVLKGRSAQVIADPDVIHTFHYIPDVAAGLVTLGSAPDDAFGRPWMLPCRPAETFRDLVRRIEKAFGAPIRLSVVPAWMQSLLGVFMPPLREMPEMRYQWEEPFVVDDSAFRARFNAAPEDADRAAGATVDWARAHYGAR